MRRLFSILFFAGLTVGAVLLFRFTLQEALIDVDIEELARYNAPQSVSDTSKGQKLPLRADTEKTADQEPPQKIDTPTQETTPTFTQTEITDTKKEVNSPPPLTRPSLSATGALTVPGVVAVTNAERTAQGLSSLTLNTKLSNAAAAKLADMFAKQYFAHVGPDGTQPSYWVESAGYIYRLTGENLALGDFSGDTDLVTAWMNSPGHRANILKPEYTEIGVAVGKGMYDGRETWLAVQIFGKPLPNCSLPNKDTQALIATNQQTIKDRQAELTAQKEALDASEPKQGSAYKEKVDIYNALVAEYNTLIGETELLVSEYNVEVSGYNACIEG